MTEQTAYCRGILYIEKMSFLYGIKNQLNSFLAHSSVKVFLRFRSTIIDRKCLSKVYNELGKKYTNQHSIITEEQS